MFGGEFIKSEQGYQANIDVSSTMLAWLLEIHTKEDVVWVMKSYVQL